MGILIISGSVLFIAFGIIAIILGYSLSDDEDAANRHSFFLFLLMIFLGILTILCFYEATDIKIKSIKRPLIEHVIIKEHHINGIIQRDTTIYIK